MCWEIRDCRRKFPPATPVSDWGSGAGCIAYSEKPVRQSCVMIEPSEERSLRMVAQSVLVRPASVDRDEAVDGCDGNLLDGSLEAPPLTMAASLAALLICGDL